ncbi:uncharacterized protein [Arachis hypogaea]|uniref:uncharacterized protein n=1 Tax=Arachis hypogaea TaxID=3818 RepID=UPI003B21B81C
MAKEFYQQCPTEVFSIRLFRHRAADPRVYNEPTVSEIAGLIVGDFDGLDTAHDIIVQWRNEDLKRIHETHTFMVESQRLMYIRFDQKNIRSHILQGVEEAMERGDVDACSIGTRIVLPSSFTGGRRYMFNNCQDAMFICKQYGYPDLFITITCNPSWLEFQRYTEQSHIAISDRLDLACRLFELKIQSLMTDLKDAVFFGPVNAAELSDPVRFPKLYSVVTKYMIHGPCGKLRPSSPCMRNGGCSKFYLKKFVDATGFDKDGYPIYRRRNMGITYKIKGVDVDNQFVVPYNPVILMKYRAHINLEFCNKSNVIKYLFKYINKGLDHVTASIRNVKTQEHGGQDVDEIKQFYDCRYLAPCESAWRLFAFDIHHKWPSVQRLIFHLPGKQNLLFTDHDKILEIRGCKSFESTHTVDGVVYDSFQGCLRQLFFTLLASNSMNKPELVWRDTWRLLADDILYYRRRELQLQDQLREEHDVNLDKLTDEQKLIYERIIDTVANNSFLCMDLVELEKHFCGDCCLPVFDQNRELF